MKGALIVLAVVVVLVLGAGAAYLWLPRRILVSDSYDPTVK